MDFEELKGLLREVNGEVLRREWAEALGTQEKREAFAVRWSPSRALAYANVVAELCGRGDEEGWSVLPCSDDGTPRAMRAVCFGGNAAEVMAFAALMRYLNPHAAGRSQMQLDESPAPEISQPLLEMTIIDSADWKQVLDKLVLATITPPPLSKYASASARAANHSLLSPSVLSLTFRQNEILSKTGLQLIDTIGSTPCLTTFFLTLSNLYNVSIPKTTAFLYRLDALLAVGSILLVIDVIGCSVPSPSAATADPESEEAKPYTLPWLLDRVLLGKPAEKVPTQGRGKKAAEEEEANKPVVRWEKIVAEDMKINKLDEKLRYPGSLENVKFQVLAYRRV